jgi:hypothetical protein
MSGAEGQIATAADTQIAHHRMIAPKQRLAPLGAGGINITILYFSMCVRVPVSSILA